MQALNGLPDRSLSNGDLLSIACEIVSVLANLASARSTILLAIVSARNHLRDLHILRDRIILISLLLVVMGWHSQRLGRKKASRLVEHSLKSSDSVI